MKTLRTVVSILLISCSLGCQQFQVNDVSNSDRAQESFLAASESNLSEVTIPKTIRELKQSLEQYSPQVKIIAPGEGKTFKQTDIELKLAVEDLPLFQDERLKLGNHLNLMVDNEPLPPVYDLEQPILLKNLIPGTHTLRVFATTPWEESFKNQGAYAQATFNVLTETDNNYPDRELPLLTYNSPTGTYGAEPILLDFYLKNPNTISNKNDNESKKPFVRATVNGTSFIIKEWQPYYLTGFEPGENWIQIELIDEFGNNIENTFNNTVRVFNYNPQQQDTLAKLVTNRLPANEAQAIVDRDYYLQPVEIPEIIGSENDSEPEIIIDVSDNESAIVAEQSTDKIVPTIKSDRDEVEIAAEETTADPLVTEEKADNDNTFPVTVPNVMTETLESEADPQDLTLTETSPSESPTQTVAIEPSNREPVTIDTELESTPEKIVIQEPESKKPFVEIIIPQPESLEINESEIAIAVPKSKPRIDLPATETETKPRFLWWKKLLVGLRQQIESLAKQLPNEV